LNGIGVVKIEFHDIQNGDVVVILLLELKADRSRISLAGNVLIVERIVIVAIITGVSAACAIVQFITGDQQPIAHHEIRNGPNQRMARSSLRRLELKRVVAIATGHGDRALPGLQDIVAMTGDDVFKSGYLILADLAAFGETRTGIDSYAGGRRRIIQRIVAGLSRVAIVGTVHRGVDVIVTFSGTNDIPATAIRQDVIAGAALQFVFPVAAEKDVGIVATIERVVSIAAIKRVATGIALQHVVAGTAAQQVGTVATGEEIISLLTEQRIVSALTKQTVVTRSAKDDVVAAAREDNVVA
jgi:hypothetical protein